MVKTSISLDQLLVLKVLGTGTFASVRQVVHRETGEVFALKKAQRSAAAISAGSEEAAEALLQREVEVHLTFRHPNIVELHGHFEDKDAVYSLQEYVGGGSLFSYMRRHGCLKEVLAVVFFTNVSEALVYLHSKGVIHRDVKPENILLTTEVPQQAKLTDFGCSAKVTPDEPERRTICGTMDYLAPEMICMEPHDHTVDIWAVGVLLYEMLVAAPPFAAASQNEALKRISDADLRCPDFLSKSAKDLLQVLLRRERTLRLPLQRALNHQWVYEHKEGSRLSNSNQEGRCSRSDNEDGRCPANERAGASKQVARNRLRSLTPENRTGGTENVPFELGGTSHIQMSPGTSQEKLHNVPGITTSPSYSKPICRPQAETQNEMKPLLSWSLGREQVDLFSPSPGKSPQNTSTQCQREASEMEDTPIKPFDAPPPYAHVLDEVTDTVRWMSGSVQAAQSKRELQTEMHPQRKESNSLQSRADSLLQQARGILVSSSQQEYEVSAVAPDDEIARMSVSSHRPSQVSSHRPSQVDLLSHRPSQ